MARVLPTILTALLILVLVVWLVVPLGSAILWSLVDNSHPWNYPDILPKALSFARWEEVWRTTGLKTALVTSYTIAPTVAVLTLLLATPTAYAFGRFDFAGKGTAQIIATVPLVLPGFVVALFFSALLYRFGIYNKFFGVVLGHCVLFLPYAIRILTVSFSQVRQDIIDAARDLGGNRWTRFAVAYLPVLRPGILAALIIVLVQSIEEFGLAFVVGAPDLTTVPTILYSYLGDNFIRPNAAVVSLVLVIPNVVLMLVLERLLRSAGPTASAGKG